MSKRLWLDLETTSTNSETGAVIQMAGMIEVGGEVKKTFNYNLKPFEGAEILDEALEVNGKTIDEIMAYPPLHDAVECLKNNMACYVNKFDKGDKFVIAGYNVNFDHSFLRETFYRSGDKYGLGSWIFNCPYDVRTIVSMAIMNKGLRLAKYRLSDLCGYFGIKIDAHDAMSDIVATRELNYELIRFIKS